MLTSKILKLKIVGLSVACLLIMTFTAHGQRNVIWTHGLQETNQAWQQYASHWETMRPVINTVNETYTTNLGMAAAATEITQDLDNQLGSTNTNPNNIGIAHGSAGLAFRQIDGTTSANNKRFGGFITMGTPNHGMYFANAKANGDLAAYTADAADKLALTQLMMSTPTVTTNGKTWSSIDFQNYANNFANQYIGNNQTATDLRTNSSFLANLPSNFTTGKPTINIYGSELAKSQWRLMSSFETKPYSLGLNTTGVEDVLTAANKMENLYRNRIILFSALTVVAVVGTVMAAAATVAAFFSPVAPLGAVAAGALLTGGGGLFTTAAAISLADVIKARNWFRDADTKWKRLTGAIRTQTSSYTYTGMSQYCLNQIAQNGWGWYYGNSQNQQTCWSGAPITYTFTQHINEVGDGLVPKSSTILPFAASLQAQGTNHFELYNHPSVEARFNEIFIGTHGVFFSIP
jgi:hypothetical protein